MNRRQFLHAPAAFVALSGGRPQLPCGVAAGDVAAGSAVIWSKTDRPARMTVEWATNEGFRDARRVSGPAATAATDFTAKLRLTGLPAGESIFYRVTFGGAGLRESEPGTGRFRAAPADRRSVSFVWGGDVAGQGWGIDRARGGMATFAAMRRLEPDFFLHCGDHVYADNPLPPEVRLPDGSVWKNLVTPAKAKVAETLDEFRGQFAYNWLDDHFRAFHSAVPVVALWDDHETRNNWFPGQMIDDPRYAERRASVLAERARQALFEYLPLPDGPVHRIVRYGPLLDVFVLDQRSFRGPNTANRQVASGPESAFLGADQLAWLKRGLAESRAVWKVIAADMPLGLIVADGKDRFENAANGDGPPLGRELEYADLLGWLKGRRVRNVVWLTADVHYAAAHAYSPAKAQFKDFDPFWEFVAGPLHAGGFGPNRLDDTFGPEVHWQSAQPGARENRPPAPDSQFFGRVTIEGTAGAMTVAIHDGSGKCVYRTELAPVQ